MKKAKNPNNQTEQNNANEAETKEVVPASVDLEALIQKYEVAFNFPTLTVDFPAIKIKTGVTTDEMSQNAQVGELYSSISGALGAEIEVTPVLAVEERLLWPQDHQAPTCQTLDGTYGSSGILCEECDKKIELLFPGSPTPEQIANSCKPRIIFVVVSSELGLPHIIAMGGMSYKTGTTWMRQIAVSLIKDTWKLGRYKVSTLQGQKTTQTGQRRVYHKYKVTPLHIADKVTPEYEALCIAAQNAGKLALGKQRDALLMSYRTNSND